VNALPIADPMKLVLVIPWLLLVPMIASAQMDHAHTPGPGEECSKLSPEFQAIVSEMDGLGSWIEASPKPESTPVLKPGIHKLEVALRPLSEVWLVGKERMSRHTPGAEGTMANKTEPSEKVDNLFGGFVLLNVPRDGLYRISTDSTLWIEIIDGGKPIERVKITPRLHCGRIHKSLGFPLKRERSYWLEMSGSKRSHVTVLFTEEPED
jgi:hypothetical protein